MSKAELKRRGFTIIEVVLVLAIAGLIFLMVLTALPALKRNQRDQARKTFQSKVSSAVTTYQSNRRNSLPATGKDFASYFDGVAATNQQSVDTTPSPVTATPNDGYADNQYIVRVTAFTSPFTTVARTDVVHVVTGAKCNTTGDSAVLGTGRQAAILMEMENGDSVVCQEV